MSLKSGRQMMRKFLLFPIRAGYRSQYDPNLDPGISNIFATAAFR